MSDFEDAVQYVICTRNNCDVLTTRNKADFPNTPNVRKSVFKQVKSDFPRPDPID